MARPRPRRTGIVEPKTKRRLLTREQRAINRAGQGRDQHGIGRSLVINDGVTSQILPDAPRY